jgi:hypothetical protein
MASGSPSTGANPSQTFTAGTSLSPALGAGGGTVVFNFNAGQRSFQTAAPSGFKSLNTANLPTPTILKGSSYFDTKLYTGNGSTQTISGLGFSPDFVWLKSRTNANWHELNDTVRGAGKILYSNQTNAEATVGTFTAFNSDGFSVSTTGGDGTNFLNAAMVGWCWDAGTSNVTNTQGSITSTVRANASAGFSIVTYTGNGTNGATVGHGLGVTPSMIIIKSRSLSVEGWNTYHASLTAGNALQLNSTQAQFTGSPQMYPTAPGSSVFTLGTNSGTNSNGATYVAYCFAPVAGFSAFGSYTGNGSADGPFVFCNFRPRWIMIKSTSVAGDWCLWDSARSPENTMDELLYADLSNAEQGNNTAMQIDACSNGFKIRGSNNQNNGSAQTYVYCCFAESPFSIARAR